MQEVAEQDSGTRVCKNYHSILSSKSKGNEGKKNYTSMLKGKRVNSLGSPKREVLQKPTCSQLGPVGLPVAHMVPSRRCPHISLDKPEMVAKPTIVLS